MSTRRVDGFFYGLFMDPVVLQQVDVKPQSPRHGWVNNFDIRIGNRATLVGKSNTRAYGMVYSMTHKDIEKLYGQPGLEDYKPEAVLVELMDGNSCVALCFNLPEPSAADESNPDYAQSLKETLGKLDFPQGYIDSIR